MWLLVTCMAYISCGDLLQCKLLIVMMLYGVENRSALIFLF